MIELDIWQLLVGFVAAMGIPSAIMGLIMKRLEKRLAKRDSLRDEQDRSQKELIVLLVQSTNASISLGEATARAVQRIPDAHCNGDMPAAYFLAANFGRDSMYFCYALGWVPAIAIAWGFYLTGRWKRKAVVPQKKQE